MTRIGIDIVEVQRIKDMVEHYGQRFLNRLFTQGEINYALSASSDLRFERLAARFAAKEALIKAVGYSLPFHSIEVNHTASGRPKITCSIISGKIEASLSHTEKLAIACVLFEKLPVTS